MGPEEFNELIEEPFKVPDLAMVWPNILEIHKEMGFSIPMTDPDKGTVMSDNEMIKEFQWIYGQYRKYIGRKKSELLSMKDNLDKMLMNILEMIEKDSESPSNRSTIIYQSLRNKWLLDTWNHVAWIIEQRKEEENDAE